LAQFRYDFSKMPTIEGYVRQLKNSKMEIKDFVIIFLACRLCIIGVLRIFT